MNAARVFIVALCMCMLLFLVIVMSRTSERFSSGIGSLKIPDLEADKHRPTRPKHLSRNKAVA